MADNTDTCVNDGCTGVRASGGEQCLAHLAPEELEAELDRLTDGVNLHGVPVSEDLLRSILDRLRGPDRSPRFAHADFSGCVFGKGADFSGCVFGKGADFSGGVFSEGVDFGGAKFGDGASFRDVRFLNDARFANATFGEGASFDRAVFEGDAYFPYARFGWGTTFGEAQFSKAARFADATFGYPAFQTGVSFADTGFALADFARATFYSGVSFDNTTFDSGVFYGSDFHGRAAFNWIGGTVSFNGATFHADTSFQGAKLRACSFESTMFGADLDFTRLQAAHAAFARVTLKGYANFQESTLKSVWLHDTVFEGDASFWGCTFAEEARFGRDPRPNAQWKATSFAGSVRFDNAQFPGEAQFDGVTVGHRLSFANCLFERERHLGPVLARGELSLDDAVFIQPTDLDLMTDRLSLRRTRFPAGANLWGRVGRGRP